MTVTINRNIIQYSLDYDEVISLPSIRSKTAPFLKWAGGKRKLVDIIINSASVSFKRYLEPFVGGGAVALALGCQWMLLNDSNVELMNTYQAVRDDLEALLPLLDEHQKKHSQAYFYGTRAQNPGTLSPIERAARFIYLNKTCFNGLYRVNKHDQFNVPFGRYVNPILYNRENIFAASYALRYAELYAEDYAIFLKQHTRPGDFIYLDPPYVPVGQFSDFKRYTKEQFREDDQRRLAELYNELLDLGAYPVLSNSYSEITLNLYAQHDVQTVYASRNINHDGTGRNPIPEILVRPRH